MAKRRILGDSVYEVRFLEVEQENIVKYVSPTGKLTDTETVGILKKNRDLESLSRFEMEGLETKKGSVAL